MSVFKILKYSFKKIILAVISLSFATLLFHKIYQISTTSLYKFIGVSFVCLCLVQIFVEIATHTFHIISISRDTNFCLFELVDLFSTSAFKKYQK
jgi:hypothetical protein